MAKESKRETFLLPTNRPRARPLNKIGGGGGGHISEWTMTDSTCMTNQISVGVFVYKKLQVAAMAKTLFYNWADLCTCKVFP